MIWAGIEALFGIQQELSFRLSLYIAKFLAGNGPSDETRNLFEDVKRMYGIRSKAVHGSKIKSDENESVTDSSRLLHRLIKKCVELDALPDIYSLIF